MTTTFQDLQDESNKMNGTRVRNEQELDALLKTFKDRPPFFFELAGENGFTLLIGFGPDVGCVQHSASDGEPPYLMAVSDETENEPFVNFLTGNTPTPIPRRFCISLDVLKRVVVNFLKNGQRSSSVVWEGI